MVSLALTESPFEVEIDVETPAADSARRLCGARSTPRAKVNGTAAYLSAERILIARSADVSLSGAFVATRNPDAIGTRAALRLEHDGKGMVADVEVVRVSFVTQPDGSGMGMGMRFCDLDREQRRFLAAYVAAHHSAG